MEPWAEGVGDPGWGHSGQLKFISVLRVLTVKNFAKGSQPSAREECVNLQHVEILFSLLSTCALHKRLSLKKLKAALSAVRSMFPCSISGFVCTK